MYRKIRKFYIKEYLLWYLKIEIYNGRRIISFILSYRVDFMGFFFCFILLNKGGFVMGLGKG